MPRGAIVCYKSWYGKGLPKVTASMVALGIKQREAGQHISARVAGGDIDEHKGHGPSLFEIFSGEGIHFQKADRRRQPGHMQFRERLVGKNDQPMIYWFEQCQDELETIMNLQHDMHDPNECTDADDHVYEQTRYVCMARPWTRAQPSAETPLENKFKTPTINELWELKQRQDTRRRD
jgi:hypothetical protein